MPRIKRIVKVGAPHHITQRGNYSQTIFENEQDYKIYQKHIEKYSQEYYLSILAYCLMPNHVHFIAIPQKENSLACTFRLTHMRYSQYFNNKHCTKGQLWQGRYYSCLLNKPHFHAAIRYVEKNPVRASLAKEVHEWEWSSARAHLGMAKSSISLKNPTDLLNFQDWNDFLKTENDEKIIDRIKKHTKKGQEI